MGRAATARSGTAALLGALLLAHPVALAAPGPTAPGSDPLTYREVRRIRTETLSRSLTGLGVPEAVIEILRDDQRVRTGRWLIGEPAGDLNGDGIDDVFEADTRYRITLGNGGTPSPEDEIVTKLTARDGATGKRIWRRKYDTDAWPVAWRVGPQGRPGVLVLGNASSLLDPTGAATISFQALDGRKGRPVWRREYSSTYSDTAVSWAAVNQMVSFGRMNAIEGRADELMLGMSTIVGTLVSSSAATTTIVVDGRDGTETTHPIVDVGIGWLPIPGAVGDLDRDGFDDVVTTNKTGVDPGGEQEPPVVGPMVYARTGAQGMPIWTESVEMELFAFARDMTDVAGSTTPEVGLDTFIGSNWHSYLLEGDYGTPWWDRRADWMHVPGDVDGDGRRDVVLTRWSGSGAGTMRVDQHAVRGPGGRIWSRRTVWDYEELPCPGDRCSTWTGMGADVNGDTGPDGVRETTLGLSVGLAGSVVDTTSWILDGRTGRLVYETEADLSVPAIAIDGRGDDLTRLTVAGNTMTLEAVDGRGKKLWGGPMNGPRKVLPRNTGHYSLGMRANRDRCGDVLVVLYDGDDTFYGVLDGGSGRILWSRWSGAAAEHPSFAVNRDRNRAC